MSRKTEVVEAWRGCFERQDWTGMLRLFTDDIERWEVGSPTKTHGKAEFEREVLPGPDVVRLANRLDRTIEEGNLVVAEGDARIFHKDGSVVNVRYCDVFEFEGEKIRRITAYGNVVPPP